MTRLMTAVYLALLIAPLVALVAIAPYVAAHYRKTRSVHIARCQQLYLTVVFFLCAYFVTMLPLPTLESVRQMTGSAVQLIPFYCVYDFFVNSSLNVSDWTSIFPALGGSIFLGIVFNVILLAPVGFFLRSLYHISGRKALLIGFLISLFFELTQLSGLFFIYPRPYRIFDVDDLMQNTLGLWLGWAAEPLLERVMPSANAKQVVRQGGQVSVRRRMLAGLIDQSILAAGTALTGGLLLHLAPGLRSMTSLGRFLVLFACYLGMCLLLAAAMRDLNGRTPGLRAVGLQLRSTRSARLCYWQTALQMVVNGVILTLPLWIALFISVSGRYTGWRRIVCSLASAGCSYGYVCYLLSLFLHTVTHGSPLVHEQLSQTHLGYDPETTPVNDKTPVYSGQLTSSGIVPGLDKLVALLHREGIDRKKAMRVQYMAEGILLEWMENGLADSFYSVRLSKRFLRKTVVISIPGPNTPLQREVDSYLEILSGTRLSFDIYYTGGVNVFAVEVP